MSPGQTPVGSSVWIVIPAFAESSVIGEVVRGVRRIGTVVVVDDGSPDDTAEVALAAGAVVLKHPTNLGQGAAVETGLEFAVLQGARAVATFDADGQHDPEDVVRMLRVLDTEGVDIVLGSRFLGTASKIPKRREWLLKAATRFTRITSGVTVSDTHNGLRVMTGRTASRLRLRQNRMAHASEIISRIGQLGLTYREVGVNIRYTDYSMNKGQRVWGSFIIVRDLLLGRINR